MTGPAGSSFSLAHHSVNIVNVVNVPRWDSG